MSGGPLSAGGLPTFDDAVRRVPFLRALSPTDRERLRPRAALRRVTRRRPVWTLGEEAREFIFAVDGHCRLVRPCESGREVIIDVGAPGELLCASAACALAPYCCTCTTIDRDVVVLVLPRRDVLDLVEQSSTAATAFTRVATGREMRLGRRIVELASGQVEQRVSALLLRLADQAGMPIHGGRLRIPVKLSRRDLAGLCGTTVETAIRTMARLSHDGTVRTTATGFIIRNRAALEALARGRSER